MKRSLIIAAALSAMALSASVPASAAPMTGQLGKGFGIQSEVQQVHWTGRRHYHGRKHWNSRKHHRRWHKRHRHCFIRIGRRVCVMR